MSEPRPMFCSKCGGFTVRDKDAPVCHVQGCEPVPLEPYDSERHSMLSARKAAK